MSARTIIEGLDDFADRLRRQIKQKMDATPRSDYAHGDQVYTLGGTPVQFVTDTIPERKTNRPRVIVRSGESTWSTFRDFITPEMPARADALAWSAARCADFQQFVYLAKKRGYDDVNELKQIWAARTEP
jgi:hypothetical protein